MKWDVGGSKRGKGRSDMNSSTFMFALSTFAWKHVDELGELHDLLWRIQKKLGARSQQALVNFLMSEANSLFMLCELWGLDMTDEVNHYTWMKASWLMLMAAELQLNFPLDGWTRRQRIEQLHDIFHQVEQVECIKELLGEDSALCAMNLLPRVALIRLGIHQELCVEHAGFREASAWKREGLRSVQARMASAKRHFDAVYRGQIDEDHIIHLVWNMMAIYHTCVNFPEKNDLIVASKDYSFQQQQEKRNAQLVCLGKRLLRTS